MFFDLLMGPFASLPGLFFSKVGPFQRHARPCEFGDERPVSPYLPLRCPATSLGRLAIGFPPLGTAPKRRTGAPFPLGKAPEFRPLGPAVVSIDKRGPAKLIAGTMTEPAPLSPPRRRFGCLQVLAILLVVMLVTAGATFWWVRHNLYAKKLEPAVFSETEKATLDGKLEQLEKPDPDRYDEKTVSRTIELSEREVNYLIAKEDPARRDTVAVDLADDLITVRLVVPTEEETPMIGGKTIRLKVGFNALFRNGKPEISLRGASVGGIGIPNAWLGNLKDQNLVEEFGEGGGFWRKFADGVEGIEVRDGKIRIDLKE